MRAFPDGAVYETKDYFDALVRARKSLALPKGVSAFTDWCDVVPLNEGRNNPHVIRLGDAERIYLYITGEHHHWVTSLDMHGESVASAICLLSRDESEAVQKYADGAAEEVDLSEAKFIIVDLSPGKRKLALVVLIAIDIALVVAAIAVAVSLRH